VRGGNCKPENARGGKATPGRICNIYGPNTDHLRLINQKQEKMTALGRARKAASAPEQPQTRNDTKRGGMAAQGAA
jgi:hypothetical protein